MTDIADKEIRTGELGKIADPLFRGATAFFALLVLVILGGVILSLVNGALPALGAFGWNFLATDSWNPVTEKFGALAPIYGTLVTSAIAMLVGVPVAFGVAVFITELCPVWLKRPIGTLIELLAAIPGIMVLPFISSIMRDVFDTVPPMLKESAYGLGATTWEVIWNVVLPFTRTGVVGGIMLGLGRALGETMAVTFVIGNAHRIQASIIAPGTTISATLANEFTEAVGDVYLSSLFALGFILFIITFIVLALAKMMLIKLEKQGGT